jgi:hypothetical protein
MSNPFWEAVQPADRQQITHEVVDHPPFFRDAVEANKLREQARGMSRQQLFDNGIIGVADLDDEELRAGRCRDNLGRIPKVTKTMENIPRDIYEAMVQEHQIRSQDKFRQAMDDALNTILDVMTDPANEPRDRLDAAKYVKEQVMGKTPDRVQVAVAKAPWEEMLGDFAAVSRQRHAQLERGVIDAEVVEPPVPQDVSEVHQTSEAHSTGMGSPRPPGFPEPQRTGPVSTHQAETPTSATRDRQVQRGQMGIGYDGPADPRITPAQPSYTHARPATSNGVIEAQQPSNSEIIRWETCDSAALAERRAMARKRIEAAKKARRARKATGGAMLARHKIHTELVGEGDTGKLRHTIE